MDDRDDDTTGGARGDLLRRLLNMGARPPPPTLTAGQLIGDDFRIERKLGAGGMGVVYLARDLRLHRDVAIKFPTAALAERGQMLLREATTLAKLIHPNVVTVYEVGTWNAHTFVAMEFVRGGTARSWLGAAPRTARAILGLYVDAGRGLAAAHAAGLAHLDFKPDNVLVGDDGRVRVADFGLARSVDDSEEHSALGTPAYMAPEQRGHGRVGPPADQFAFAVALREALAPTPRIAPHVDRALRRALAPDPDARFPSMDALLAELTRDPEARRRRIALIAVTAGAVAALGAGATWLAVGDRIAPRVSCAVADDALDGVWDPPRRAAVRAAFVGSTRVDAAAIFERVAALLDQRARAWLDTRVAVCQATHVRGEQSAQLLDLRVRCLDRRRDELGALVDVLATGDAAVVDRAVEATAVLRSLDSCADGAALLAAVPPPDDPAARATIAAIERRLADLDARRAAGRYAEALPLATALVADVLPLRYPPLTARVSVAHAKVLAALGRRVEAEAAYLASVAEAASARDDQTSLDAWRGVIDLRGEASLLAGADLLIAAATAAANRLGPDDGGRAALDQSLAMLRARQGRLPEMLAHATAAHAWFAAHRPGTLDEAAALDALARAFLRRSELEPALARNAEALALLIELLGVDHPTVAESRRSRSKILAQLSRFAEARAELTGTSAAIERAYGVDSLPSARVALAIADLEFWQGRYPESERTCRGALAIVRRRGSALDVAQLLTMIARAAAADLRQPMAKDALVEALAVADGIDPPNDTLHVSVLTHLGGTLTALGDLASAQRHLDRARALATQLHGADSVVVAQIENTLAATYATVGDTARAVAGYQRVIAIVEGQLGPDAIDALYAHANLGDELGRLGRWAEAVVHLEHAIRGLDRVLGPDHPVLCTPLAVIAFGYAQLGRGADGVRAAERGLAIRTARRDPYDPYLQLGLGAALWADGALARGRKVVAAAARTLGSKDFAPVDRQRALDWLRSHGLTPARR